MDLIRLILHDMLNRVYRTLPKFISLRIINLKNFIYFVLSRVISSTDGNQISKYRTLGTLRLIDKWSNKKKIKVAFIVFDPAVWKYEDLYRAMLDDTNFEPRVVIAKKRSVEISRKEIESVYIRSFNFFKTNHLLLDNNSSNYKIQLNYKRIFDPDIVVNSLPYDALDSKFYVNNNKDIVSIYGQYGINVTSWKSVIKNKHNLMLTRMYVESDIHFRMYSNWLEPEIVPMIVSGPLIASRIYYKKRLNFWPQNRDRRIRIIWSPHWNVTPDVHGFQLGNFLEFSSSISDLADQYSNFISICLKPHPLLREVLVNNKNWGKEKTDKFFFDWQNRENTFIETGDYIELFNSSDAMINDSGSFLGEYFFTGKPFAQIVNDHQDGLFNEFGELLLDSTCRIINEEDLHQFVLDLIGGIDRNSASREYLYTNYLKKFHFSSTKIIMDDIYSLMKI